MNDLRFTDTNAADDSAGRVFGLDGNLYLAVVGAGLAAVGIFAALSLWLHTNWALAGAIAALPPAVTVIWAVWLKHGRPAGYDRDKLEDLLRGGDFGPGAGAGLAGRSHDRAPDGRLIDLLGRNQQRDLGPASPEFSADGQTRKQVSTGSSAGDGDVGISDVGIGARVGSHWVGRLSSSEISNGLFPLGRGA